MNTKPKTLTTESAVTLDADEVASRMIDTWFPCREVDRAVKTPAGSGLSEKALFTWFASRPIAQARAAVLCSLLADTDDNRSDIRAAVEFGDIAALARLRERVLAQFSHRAPVVLDVFSGRGIIPLEAARLGVTAIGTDLSPVATLGGRLLADYPLRDWSSEPPLPFRAELETGADSDSDESPDAYDPTLFGSEAEGIRLLEDVRVVLAEVAKRVAERVSHHYPGNPSAGGAVPWAYLWSVTIPCDGCRLRFPLIGSMVLRNPYGKTDDQGQSMRLVTKNDEWQIEIVAGVAQQSPTFSASDGKRGKSARCPFPTCGMVHSLDTVKAKGFAGQYSDAMLAVGEPQVGSTRKVFRVPRSDEIEAAASVDLSALEPLGSLSAIPDERIPLGNSNTVQALLSGYQTYGSLMNNRQAFLFATTARVIAELHKDLSRAVSPEYAEALAGYAAANLPRQLRRATRGANLEHRGSSDGLGQNRVFVGDVFSSQSVLKHQFDYIEAGPALGPGTWLSVSNGMTTALRSILKGSTKDARSARLQRASAVSLPFRDASVDAIVTDPPYYDMITYADSSDLAHAWLKRALCTVVPDLFDGRHDGPDGLQSKSDEIIVKSKGRRTDGEHRTTDFYEAMLAKSFVEARRVLRPQGHLTVVFGHADPEAWKRLLGALTRAGFIVTSSWPSRTETAVTGVATISVTVSIGARVAPLNRPVGIAAVVDSEVVGHVKQRCKAWDADSLALEDQLMASYGAALTVVGRYARVITPSGDEVPLEHYMALARRAVRDAVALRLDDLPLDTFDPLSRLAVFWHELYGRNDVPKGEARFFAQSDDLRLEDLRGPILLESKKGFALRHDAPERVIAASSTYEVVRAMAGAWPRGSDAVGAALATAERTPTDAHVWAIVAWLATKLPASDMVAKQLAAIQRNRGTIQAAAAAAVTVLKTDSEPALTLFNLGEQP
jgi:putative DNA methylase